MKEHKKFSICIAGAVSPHAYEADALEKAEHLGGEIAKLGGVVITGAGAGFPLWATSGAKQSGGMTLMFSPAGNRREHAEAYRLPTNVHDVIIYTGFGYVGSDLLMTKSSDAVIVGVGGVGTIHEFTMAYEEGKPIGVLEGAWETDEVIRAIIGKKHRTDKPIVFDSDPRKLVRKVVEIIQSR